MQHARSLGALVTAELSGSATSLVLAIAAVIGVAAMDLLAPWPLKFVFDHVLLDVPPPAQATLLTGLLERDTELTLLLAAGAIVVIALANALFSYLHLTVMARLGLQLTHRLRAELFARVQRLSLAFHQRNRTGELLTRIAADTEAIRDLFSEWALTILIQSLTLLAMMAIMLWINWRLSLVAIAVVPALFFVLVHLNRKIRHNVRKQRRQEGRIASTLSEVLGSMAVVQAFGRQSYEHERFVAQSEENLRAGVRTARSSAAVTRAVTLVSACGVAATVIVGARHVVAGLMTPGELLIFVAYVNNLYKPIRHIGKLSAKVFRASVSAQRIDELLRIEPDLEDHPSAGPAPPLHGTISFDGVTFGYAGKAPILNELNLTIEAGTLTAIVGASGSGKSTLVSLLLRLYDPAAGCITVDGVDVADWTRESVRRQVGCVLQDVLLFDTSVAENIAYGSPGAGATAIEQAARAAGADAFIRALPQGYDSVLGERAATLSGGQRQRLSLARALLKDPPILVLDEPTSAIDAAGVSAILDTLTAMRGTKTIVVVTHDLHDMARFDQIVVLAQGRVVEQGTHAGLLRRGGHYASLQRGAASRAAEAVPPATTAATNMRGRGGM